MTFSPSSEDGFDDGGKIALDGEEWKSPYLCFRPISPAHLSHGPCDIAGLPQTIHHASAHPLRSRDANVEISLNLCRPPNGLAGVASRDDKPGPLSRQCQIAAFTPWWALGARPSTDIPRTPAAPIHPSGRYRARAGRRRALSSWQAPRPAMTGTLSRPGRRHSAGCGF